MFVSTLFYKQGKLLSFSTAFSALFVFFLLLILSLWITQRKGSLDRGHSHTAKLFVVPQLGGIKRTATEAVAAPEPLGPFLVNANAQSCHLVQQESSLLGFALFKQIKPNVYVKKQGRKLL